VGQTISLSENVEISNNNFFGMQLVERTAARRSFFYEIDYSSGSAMG